MKDINKIYAFTLNLGIIYISYHSPKYSHPEHSISNRLLCIRVINKYYYIKIT